MSGNIDTREFSISDYDAAAELWQRVEGLEIAENDDKESVAQFLARNPALSRVAIDGSRAVGVALCGHDGILEALRLGGDNRCHRDGN
jgi:N-acetylglutamate synthase